MADDTDIDDLLYGPSDDEEPPQQTYSRTSYEDDEKSENYRVTAGELRQFVERYERLDEEKKAISEQQKEVMAEAKGRGYDVKVLRKIIALRKRDENDIAEEEAVLAMYCEALGMNLREYIGESA